MESYRSILVHLDETPRCAARVEIAARLAIAQQAHLFGLAPSGRVNLPARATPARRGEPTYLELAQAGLDERARALAHTHAQRMRAAGVASCEARHDEEDGVTSLLAHAAVHDLVVVGQTDRTSPAASIELDIPEQMVVHAGAPVLIVPSAGEFGGLDGVAVVAWNGTRESARAARDALPLLRRARGVHLMCFERARDLSHVPRLRLNDAKRWFARHEVEATLHQEPVAGDVGEALLACAARLGAGLVVMGGYGHSRMTEFLLGGVTRRLLAQMTTPVLMSH